MTAELLNVLDFQTDCEKPQELSQPLIVHYLVVELANWPMAGMWFAS